MAQVQDTQSNTNRSCTPATGCPPAATADDAGRLVEQAAAAAQEGRRSAALALLDQALACDEDHLEALLWRGGLSEPNISLPYLERASIIAPDDERVRQGLAWARRRVGLEAPAPVAAPQTSAPAPVLPAAPARKSKRADHGHVSLPRLARRLTLTLVAVITLLVLLAVASAARLGTAADDGQSLDAPQIVSSALAILAPAPTATATATPTPTPTETPTPLPTATPTQGPDPLDLAWAAEDWPQVIALVETAAAQAPAGSAWSEKLFAAHYNYAVQLAKNDRLADALTALDKALAVSPGDVRAMAARKLLQPYMQGSTALAAGDFAAAISALRSVYDSDKAYLAARERLYQAYVGQAAALEKSGKLADAYAAYQKAAQVDAAGSEAQAGVGRLKPAAPTPTATPSTNSAGKKIEVDIAKQQVTAWQDGTVVYRFKASTGKAPYLTRKGNFKIQSKMPNAYSSAMQWGMPWWMGIYYAGKWENGFHAMARLGPKQVVMSERVLGTPQTHGCIMLSDKNAKTLYDWAEIGTAVWIH